MTTDSTRHAAAFSPMHVQTHIMSGWCIGSAVPGLAPRQRLFCMIAATIPDLDGLSLLAGQNAYFQYHHRLCHNLPFAILSCGVMAALAWRRSWRGPLFLALLLALFHLHLVLDIVGSGPGWNIYYFWPFSNYAIDNRPWSWEFDSWQNRTAAGLFAGWMLLIAVFQSRTPLEALMPSLDRQLVQLLRKWFGLNRQKQQDQTPVSGARR